MYGRNIFGIIFIFVVFFLIAIFAEPYVFEFLPPQLPVEISMKQWKDSFQRWAGIGVGIAGVMSLLWYGFAQWGFKINSPQGAGKRLIWGLFFLFSIIGAIISIIFTERAESMFLANLFFILNGVAPYYLATLLFSPSSFKYAPLGASRIRHQR